MKNAMIGLLVVMLAISPAWADSGPDQKHIESIRKKVAHCVDAQRRVVLETYDGRRLQGYISEAQADDFTLAYGGQTTTLTYQDVKKIKWQSAVSKQVKVIVGTAAIVGALYGLVVLFGGLRG
jgi:hypothetical protein